MTLSVDRYAELWYFGYSLPMAIDRDHSISSPDMAFFPQKVEIGKRKVQILVLIHGH